MAEQQSGQNTNVPEGAKAVPPKGKTGGNKTLIIVLVVVGVLFVLPGIVFGVGVLWLSSGDNAENLTESIIENSTDNAVDVNTDDGSLSISGEEGDLNIGGDQKLPDTFPEEVKVFDPQKITASVSNDDESGASWYVAAEAESTVADIDTFLGQAYADWSTKSSSTINESRGYSYENETYRVAVSVVPQDDEKTLITYTVTEK